MTSCQDLDECLRQLDSHFVDVLEAIEDTPDQRAYWETQATHWTGGGNRAYIEDYNDLVRLHAEMRELMNRRQSRTQSPG